MFFNICNGFPHFPCPQQNGLVGRHFLVEKLSTVIPVVFPLCGLLNRQKNFYPTYPPINPMFPPGYPRFTPQDKSTVEKPVEKWWITTENSPQ